jgi:hypothetical protein
LLCYTHGPYLIRWTSNWSGKEAEARRRRTYRKRRTRFRRYTRQWRNQKRKWIRKMTMCLRKDLRWRRFTVS